jgi:hypothetical protein
MPNRKFASIPSRRITIAGHPDSGWSSADEGTPGSFDIEFRFDVTDDGGGNFLLVYSSLDGRYAADSWHASLDEALGAAEDQFGIERGEWSEM